MKTSAFGEIDWDAIVQIRTSPKLEDLCSNPRLIYEEPRASYFQIGPMEYVRTSHEWKDRDFTETLVANKIYWAPTLAVFHRIVIRDAEKLKADDESILPLPNALRLSPHCTSYEEIRRFCTDSQIRSNEMDLFDAKGRWAPDGKSWLSIGSCFLVSRFTYHFRSSLPIPSNELPYAAGYEICNDEWLKKLWSPGGGSPQPMAQ